jgi:hypothetical protein
LSYGANSWSLMLAMWTSGHLERSLHCNGLAVAGPGPRHAQPVQVVALEDFLNRRQSVRVLFVSNDLAESFEGGV